MRDKQLFIINLIKIILLELENYNNTAEMGYEISIEDLQNYIKDEYGKI